MRNNDERGWLFSSGQASKATGMEKLRKNQGSFLKSFVYAWAGLSHAFKTQRNMKIHGCLALLALVLCGIFKVTAEEWLAVVICIGAVIGLECLNTALEAVVDLASPEIHPLAKTAKDCAAGAVLVMAFVSVAVACIIFLPRIVAL